MGNYIIYIISIVLSIAAISVAARSMQYAKKQYRSGIRPELWSRNWGVLSVQNQVEFDIENRSDNTAIIMNVVPKGRNISLCQPFKRYELTNNPNDRLIIRCYYHGKDIHKDSYKLKVKYTDKEKNAYTAYLYVNKKGNYIV